MIKAVIFDCFGVLTTHSFDVFRTKYFSADPKKRKQANELMNSLNAAQISYATFLQKLSGLSGLSEQKIEEYLSENKANEPLFTYIRTKLKSKYKIGLLSNAGGNWLEQLFSEEDIELFDDIVLSFEFGITKPHPKIFDLAANRLGVKTSECVFIDDNDSHCLGANKAGMKSVCYKDFFQMKSDLQKILTAAAND
jgi:putative hydrolase of the HAD superfamily